jgi:hypothetical protein
MIGFDGRLFVGASLIFASVAFLALTWWLVHAEDRLLEAQGFNLSGYRFDVPKLSVDTQLEERGD